MTPEVPGHAERFGFSESEVLFNRISDTRFFELVQDDQSTVHRMELSSNNYGEFLFVTVSRPGSEQRSCVTFFGLGFHDWRECWLVDQWFWYRAQPSPEVLESIIPADEVERLLLERHEMIRPLVTQNLPSEQAQRFSMLADLTDDDYALSEIEDWLDLADGHDG